MPGNSNGNSEIDCDEISTQTACENSLTCEWDPEEDLCMQKDIEERFTKIFGRFEFNQSCMIITIIFLILFIYKEEIMRTKFVKNLIK